MSAAVFKTYSVDWLVVRTFLQLASRPLIGANIGVMCRNSSGGVSYSCNFMNEFYFLQGKFWVKLVDYFGFSCYCFFPPFFILAKRLLKLVNIKEFYNFSSFLFYMHWEIIHVVNCVFRKINSLFLSRALYQKMAIILSIKIHKKCT